MKSINGSEFLGYLFLTVVLLIGIYYAVIDLNYFDTVYTVEDGAIEYGTSLLLFSISILCMYRLIKMWKFKTVTWKTGVFLFALLFFFGAGEEISWGQRIFGVESSDFFIENNAQGETNLHNMVVGGKKINKIVFSQLLMVIMVVYLILAPILFRRNSWFKNLANRFAVPIVKWHHTIAFLISTILVMAMPSSRKWEVYELVFGVIFFLIFLYPLNAYIFKTSRASQV